MKTKILNFSVEGIKNISECINLQFSNKKLTEASIKKITNIKAIYGENGSGKSGIVHAFDIYKGLLGQENYLTINNDEVTQLINVKTKIFKLRVEFILSDERYNHEIHISAHNGEASISYERITQLKFGNGEETFSLTSDGNSIIDLQERTEPWLKDFFMKTVNKVKKNSFCYYLLLFAQDPFYSITDSFIKYLNDTSLEIVYNKHDSDKDSVKLSYEDGRHFYILFILMYSAFKLGNELSVFLDDMDIHSENGDTSNQFLDLKIHDIKEEDCKIIKADREFIATNELDEYLISVNKLKEFIQLFKPNLVNIDIERKTVSSNEIQVTKIMNYGDYTINCEFESAGIKKLISLFSLLENCASGGIVVIDELDSNINDVYLNKIVSFFEEFGEGQLIFTTHNVSPMEVLSKRTYAIDFLTNDSRVVQWKKNGNYSPAKLYREGYINYLPFNIEADDFVKVFNRCLDNDSND